MSKKNCTFAQLKFNIMTLGRKLIFTDQFELNAYLQDNVLNTELYKAFLSVKDHRYRWKHTPVETFNEVYYQCTRVFNDPNPESDILGSYLNDAKDNIVCDLLENLEENNLYYTNDSGINYYSCSNSLYNSV